MMSSDFAPVNSSDFYTSMTMVGLSASVLTALNKVSLLVLVSQLVLSSLVHHQLPAVLALEVHHHQA